MGQEHITRIDRGSPITLVCIHGIWGSRLQLRKYWDCEYNVVALDLPGHGGREAQLNMFETAVEEQLKLIEEVQSEHIILIGFSLGGFIAQEVIKRTNKVSALVLISTASYLLKVDREEGMKRMLLNLAIQHPTLTKESINILYEFVDGAEVNLQRCNLKASLELLVTVEDKDFRPTNNQFQKPVLIAHGSEDKLIPFQLGKEMAESFPQGIFTSLPEGHNTMKNDVFTQDQFSRFVQLINLDQ